MAPDQQAEIGDVALAKNWSPFCQNSHPAVNSTKARMKK